MESSNLLSSEFKNLKLPNISKLRRPRTNYFKEKERKTVSEVRNQLVSRGKSKEFLRIQQENLALIPEKPCTKIKAKWSKRISFSKRTDMATKNLIIFVFDGVLGDCFKKNLWGGSPVKLYLRRGVVKELKKLKEDFQIVLFFISEDIKARKVLKYLEGKDIEFDAVYRSLNFSRFAQKTGKNLARRPLKYSEFFQDFSQVYLDFGLQHEIHDRVLVVSSNSLTVEDFERKGDDLIFHRNSARLVQFLCKAIPVPTPLADLPLVLSIPDPRLHHNFAGASFTIIVNSIYQLSRSEDEWSWMDNFPLAKFDSVLSSFPIQELFSKSKKAKNQRDPCHKFLILKQTSLTGYNFIEDHSYSLKPLCLKNV